MRIYPWLVAEEDGRIAGYAYAGRQSARAAYAWSAEVTVYLDPDYQRRGLGRRLYQCAVRGAEGAGGPQPDGHHRLAERGERRAAPRLRMDMGVCREAGFKFGAWRDVFPMGAVLGDRSTAVESPKPVTELGNLEAFL